MACPRLLRDGNHGFLSAQRAGEVKAGTSCLYSIWFGHLAWQKRLMFTA